MVINRSADINDVAAVPDRSKAARGARETFSQMLSISRTGEVTQLASAAPVVFVVERAACEGRRRGGTCEPGHVTREWRERVVEFGVLGAFEIRGADGQAFAVGGAKRRGVAALLAVRAGRPCSLDLLVEALWGSEPPAGAAGTVRTYVSQLRRRFGFPIETTPSGYILAVPRESVDALRFEHLVEAARRNDDTSRRVTLLGDALALWRGEALAEFAGLRWADEQARCWDRLRHEVVQERVRTRLASGEDAVLIGELERLVEQYPFDEQLTADLMLACYRSGRQADALREYAGLRHRLADELGIGPSAELAELERRMLDHDPSLDCADTTRAGFGPTSPIADSLPEGVVTFLLTDIEGSTELWDRHAVEMSGALVRHEGVINGIVGSHRGRLLKSRGEGDATLSVFSVATDAVAAAVALQRALGGTTWQGGLSLATRVAVHAGEAHLREGDYYGGTLNRASRIRSLAAGGQVLLSRATHDLVVDTLANDLSLVELGAYELRGLHRDETVFAVAAAGLAPVAPPAGRAPALGLGPANTVVGRAGTLGQFAAELEVPGPVTITGPCQPGESGAVGVNATRMVS